MSEFRMDRTAFRIRSSRKADALFPEHHLELLRALNREKVEYILVGTYAMLLHGFDQSREILDVWLSLKSENYSRTLKIFNDFETTGIDLTNLSLSGEEMSGVFTFSTSLNFIDSLAVVNGLNFKTTYLQSYWYQFEDASVRLIRSSDLAKVRDALELK